ncbi:hypothetical protein BB558_007293 [Smittium angustum]|uniref:DNA endonuclease activator Ctp1 C-terminal domain-containing protein n=2 Tax=Smittium angustum TaxID=133377 RepID=A0A2U1IVE7_SMIAN|nr:hypothetical protein BB558_007293 [Smittium angustum]
MSGITLESLFLEFSNAKHILEGFSNKLKIYIDGKEDYINKLKDEKQALELELKLLKQGLIDKGKLSMKNNSPFKQLNKNTFEQEPEPKPRNFNENTSKQHRNPDRYESPSFFRDLRPEAGSIKEVNDMDTFQSKNKNPEDLVVINLEDCSEEETEHKELCPDSQAEENFNQTNITENFQSINSIKYGLESSSNKPSMTEKSGTLQHKEPFGSFSESKNFVKNIREKEFNQSSSPKKQKKYNLNDNSDGYKKKETVYGDVLYAPDIRKAPNSTFYTPIKDNDDIDDKKKKAKTEPYNLKKRTGINEIKYVEVVRDKQKRKSMHGVGCPCCNKFYELAGPLKQVENIPKLMRNKKHVEDKKEYSTDESSVLESPTTSSSKAIRIGHKKGNKNDQVHFSDSGESDFISESEKFVKYKKDLSKDVRKKKSKNKSDRNQGKKGGSSEQEFNHVNTVSRHRYVAPPPPSTPSEFWNVDFPSSPK